MAVVHRAVDTRLDREVALKVLRPDLDGLGESRQRLRERFWREARSAAAIEHPNVAGIYDVGEDQGQLYLAMELVEGTTLREVLRAEAEGGDERPSSEVVLARARDIASGLAAAHAAGIVHRDLKPENVMIRPSGEAVLLDLGLARRFDRPLDLDQVDAKANLETADAELTAEGSILGTPQYMSPEQAAAGALDARSDVFSFGTLLYEMLAGERPFDETGGAVQLLVSIARDAPLPLEVVADDVDAELGLLVRRCLEKKPEQRYADGTALLKALLEASAETPAPASQEASAADVSETAAKRRSMPGPDEIRSALATSSTDIERSRRAPAQLDPRRTLPLLAPLPLAAIGLVALVVGAAIQLGPGEMFDRPVHDAAVAHRPRTTWHHGALVGFDAGLPPDLATLQMLPLVGRAVDVLVRAGAAAVLIDARLLAYPGQDLPVARCLELDDGLARARMASGSEVAAPLLVDEAAASRLLLPPPILPGSDAQAGCDRGRPPTAVPLALLVGPRSRHDVELVCVDAPTSAGTADGVMRWFSLGSSFAAIELFRRTLPADVVTKALAPQDTDGTCGLAEATVPCRRLRTGTWAEPTTWVGASSPQSAHADPSVAPARPVLALSGLADCDAAAALARVGDVVKDRAVVIQMSDPSSRVDLHAVPSSVSVLGSGELLAGPQLLIEMVETLAAGDHPRPPPSWLTWLFILGAAALSTLAGAYLRPVPALTVVAVVAATGVGLCLIEQAPVTLWPVAAPSLASLIGVVGGMVAHLGFRTREGEASALLLPPELRRLLVQVGGPDRFLERREVLAVVASEPTGLERSVDLLGSSRATLDLLNDYLEATAGPLQRRWGAWLDRQDRGHLVGYWPTSIAQVERSAAASAVRAAFDLAQRQAAWIENLPEADKGGLDRVTRLELQKTMAVNVGADLGPAVLGRQGAAGGVQRLGVVGDVVGRAERCAELCRSFSAGALVTGDLWRAANLADDQELRGRRVCNVLLGASPEPVELIALGTRAVPGFTDAEIEGWATWLKALEEGEAAPAPPASLQRDAATLMQWRQAGDLDPERRAFRLA